MIEHKIIRMEHACLLNDGDFLILYKSLLMFLAKIPPIIESSAIEFLNEKFYSSGILLAL